MGKKTIVPENRKFMNRRASLPERVGTIFPAIDVTYTKPHIIANSSIMLLLSLLSIFVALIENGSYESKDLQVNPFQLSCRVCIIFTTITQIGLLCHYWHLRTKLNKSYSVTYSATNTFSGSNCKKLLASEFAITCIIKPLYFNPVLYETNLIFFTLDDLLTILILFRTYFIFRFIYDFSYFNSTKARWVW